ncbi:CD63 antigen-like [Branchiostoma floridae]|uniref:Tetraspanin n=1 Tax=Branchiostoma floridae TaxID=7739 RepID=A0A9J7KLV5_BRAFL|nr:CD63 antigen-like [Branchiostoma floridae]
MGKKDPPTRYKPHNPGYMGCLQILLLSTNLMYMVGGALLIVAVLSANLRFEECLQDKSSEEHSVDFMALRNTCLLVGGLIFVTGTVGCFAAWKESYYVSLVYCFFIGLLFILTSAAVTTLLAMHLLRTTYNNLDKFMTYTMKAKGPERIIIDIFQNQFECCGVHGYKDWFGHPRTASLGPKSVPPSCCKNVSIHLSLDRLSKICDHSLNITFARKIQSCGADMGSPAVARGKIYTQGCVQVTNDLIMKHIVELELAVGILAILEMLGMLYACCFMRETRRKEYEQYRAERKYRRLLHDDNVIIE